MKWILSLSIALLSYSAAAVDIVQVFDQALQNDPQFAISVVNNKVQHETARNSISFILPSISVSSGRSENKRRSTFPSELVEDPRYGFLGVTPENNAQWITTESPPGWSVSVGQSLIDSSSMINWITSRKNRASADFDLINSEHGLILRVATAYLDVLRARDRLESAIASEEAVQRQLESAQQRYDVGLTAVTDVLNANANLDNAKVQRIDAVGALDIEFEDLRALTGQVNDELARISEDLPIVIPEPSNVEVWVDFALNNNPQLLAAEKNYEAAKLRHTGQLASHLPRITMGLSYSVSEQPFSLGGNPTPYDVENESLGQNLSLSFTVFQGGSRISQTRISAFNKETARLQVIQQRILTEQNVRTRFRQVATDVVRVDASKTAIQSSEASLQATQTGYDVGTRNIVELLNAQQALFQSQYQYDNTRYSYILSMLQLKQSAGSLSPNELIELNAFMDNNDTVKRVTSLSGS